MRINTPLLVAIGLLLALATFVFGGPPEGRGKPAQSHGPGFNRDNNPGILGKQATELTSPVFNSQNNPGVQGSQFGRTKAAEVQTSSGGEHRSQALTSAGKAEKVVIEHRSSAIESALTRSVITGGTDRISHEAGKGESAETKRKFGSSLLDAGITPVPSPTLNKGIDTIPVIDPIPSPFPLPKFSPIPKAEPKTTPKGNHHGWRKPKNPHSLKDLQGPAHPDNPDAGKELQGPILPSR